MSLVSSSFTLRPLTSIDGLKKSSSHKTAGIVVNVGENSSMAANINKARLTLGDITNKTTHTISNNNNNGLKSIKSQSTSSSPPKQQHPTTTTTTTLKSPRKFTFDDRVVQGAIRAIENELTTNKQELQSNQVLLHDVQNECDVLKSQLEDAKGIISHSTLQLSEQNLNLLATVSIASNMVEKERKFHDLLKTSNSEKLQLDVQEKQVEIQQLKQQQQQKIQSPIKPASSSSMIEIQPSVISTTELNPQIKLLRSIQMINQITTPHLVQYIEYLIDMAKFIHSHLQEEFNYQPSKIMYNIFDPTMVNPPRSDLNKIVSGDDGGIDDVEQLVLLLIRLHSQANKILSSECDYQLALSLIHHQDPIIGGIFSTLGFQTELENRLSSIIRFHLRNALDPTKLNAPIYLVLNTTPSGTSWSMESLVETPSEAVASFFHRALTLFATSLRETSSSASVISRTSSSTGDFNKGNNSRSSSSTAATTITTTITTTTNSNVLLLAKGQKDNSPDYITEKERKIAVLYIERMLDIIRRLQPFNRNRALSWHEAQRWAIKALDVGCDVTALNGLELLANVQELSRMVSFNNSFSSNSNNNNNINPTSSALRANRKNKILKLTPSGWKNSAVAAAMSSVFGSNNNDNILGGVRALEFPQIKFILD
jgi:hypothetical protein